MLEAKDTTVTLIATISPLAMHATYSMHTLDFADKVHLSVDAGIRNYARNSRSRGRELSPGIGTGTGSCTGMGTDTSSLRRHRPLSQAPSSSYAASLGLRPSSAASGRSTMTMNSARSDGTARSSVADLGRGSGLRLGMRGPGLSMGTGTGVGKHKVGEDKASKAAAGAPAKKPQWR